MVPSRLEPSRTFTFKVVATSPFSSKILFAKDALQSPHRHFVVIINFCIFDPSLMNRITGIHPQFQKCPCWTRLWIYLQTTLHTYESFANLLVLYLLVYSLWYREKHNAIVNKQAFDSFLYRYRKKVLEIYILNKNSKLRSKQVECLDTSDRFTLSWNINSFIFQKRGKMAVIKTVWITWNKWSNL